MTRPKSNEDRDQSLGIMPNLAVGGSLRLHPVTPWLVSSARLALSCRVAAPWLIYRDHPDTSTALTRGVTLRQIRLSWWLVFAADVLALGAFGVAITAAAQ